MISLIVHDGSKLIINEIKINARSKIRAIEKETSAKIDVINRETDLELKGIKERILEDAKKRAEGEKKKIDAQTNVEISRRLGDARAEIIEECISAAFDELKKTPPPKIKNELTTLLKTGLENCPARKIELIVNKQTCALFGPKNFKDIEKKTGKKIILRIRPMSGGMILHDVSNNMFLDYSFESLFRTREDEIRKSASMILFGL